MRAVATIRKIILPQLEKLQIPSATSRSSFSLLRFQRLSICRRQQWPRSIFHRQNSIYLPWRFDRGSLCQLRFLPKRRRPVCHRDSKTPLSFVNPPADRVSSVSGPHHRSKYGSSSNPRSLPSSAHRERASVLCVGRRKYSFPHSERRLQLH